MERKVIANEVGLGLVEDVLAYLDSLSAAELTRYLIGGLSVADLPSELDSGYTRLANESHGGQGYLLPPLPNTLYTRDTTSWLYEGVTLNPLYWPARTAETLLMKAISSRITS